MIRLTSVEVNNFTFNINHENNKLELDTDTFEEISFGELKGVHEEFVKVSKISHEHLQDEKIAPRIISVDKSLETEKRQTFGYYVLRMGYAGSLFRDFESYFETVVDLDEHDIELILKQNNSKFITTEISPDIFTTEDISGFV